MGYVSNGLLKNIGVSLIILAAIGILLALLVSVFLAAQKLHSRIAHYSGYVNFTSSIIFVVTLLVYNMETYRPGYTRISGLLAVISGITMIISFLTIVNYELQEN